MTPETLPVVFRVFRKEICAYFPTLPWTGRGDVTCYAHVGQHGGADRAWLAKGKRATPEQYAPLLAELSDIYAPEYALKVYQRAPRA